MYNGAKFDEWGDLINSDSLSPKQQKYFQMRYFYKYVPEKTFLKAFNKCWNNSGIHFEGGDLDVVLEPMVMAHEKRQSDKEMRANAQA